MAQTISTDRAADVPHELYVKELQRADRLQQEVSRLMDELKKVRCERDHANENLARAIRTVERAVAERDAALEIERDIPYQFEAVTSW